MATPGSNVTSTSGSGGEAEWQFLQCFGERTEGEDIQDGARLFHTSPCRAKCETDGAVTAAGQTSQNHCPSAYVLLNMRQTYVEQYLQRVCRETHEQSSSQRLAHIG